MRVLQLFAKTLLNPVEEMLL